MASFCARPLHRGRGHPDKEAYETVICFPADQDVSLLRRRIDRHDRGMGGIGIDPGVDAGLIGRGDVQQRLDALVGQPTGSGNSPSITTISLSRKHSWVERGAGTRRTFTGRSPR